MAFELQTLLNENSERMNPKMNYFCAFYPLETTILPKIFLCVLYFVIVDLFAEIKIHDA